MPEPQDQPAFLVRVTSARVRIGRRKSLEVGAFEILPGQHWCVFGGNGAGKSLLCRLLLGTLPTGARHVEYGPHFEVAEDVVTVSFEEQQRLWGLDNRHDISEFSASALDVGTTVEQLVRGDDKRVAAYPPEHGLAWRALGLEQLRNCGIRYLSSGQVRKAMIAGAVAGKRPGRARLLVLDEPLEALDRQSRPAAERVLSQWMDHQDATLLLCRREQDILPGITHVAIMDDLRMVAQGSIDQVRSSEAYRRIASGRLAFDIRLPVCATKATGLPGDVPLVRLEGVSAGYGDRQVLCNFSWRMHSWNHTLVEGPNGCGKSTLLSLIDGENHKAYGQQVFLFGHRRGSGESVWQVKSHFGVISNEIHNRYVRGWRVLEVVVSGFFDSMGLYDDSGASQVEHGRRWLQALGIDGLARDYYHEISFGQQRLVLLARAMVKQPDILVLDEPCVGLDDYHRRLILRVVDLIAATGQTRILYVSHTEGEEPACINQRIRFVPKADFGFDAVVSTDPR